MRLLVSAANAADAAAALDGGAAFVDAKNPAAGALGAVTLAVFHDIVSAVNGRRPVTAALGDAVSPASIEADAHAFARAGASLVKVGFDGVREPGIAHDLAAAAVRGASRGGGAGVVLVAYADRSHACVSPAALLDVASSTGAAGVLLDTADKRGSRLTELASRTWLAAWVERAHRRSLSVALAGRLRADDLPLVRHVGADIAGVRGAACTGGRGGVVDAARVRALLDACPLARELGST
jgi:uncharacterized protein (UPF0264 family)